ncbi:DUF334 domain-containing protein [Staphylococcus equorum]|uniref:DUF334 domain-containing protein n=1 Tax=Staphylococcus equorum TaxID=246432 RepID=UPI001C4033CE|nr:DUF334 domain-containing protein [Staphylococcus equorum]
MKDLEDKENKRVEQHNQLIKKIEESTSTFNQASDDLHVRYTSVANAYLNKINTDNQEQDFQKALDNKFKKIDNNTKTLMNWVIESNKQTRTEIQEYKKTLEGKFQDNDKLMSRYNKSLDFMIKGITAMFFVVVVMALILVVTGPLGEFVGVPQIYNSIDHEIKTHDSIWRYLYYLLYLIPYTIFALLILGVLKACEGINGWLRL